MTVMLWAWFIELMIGDLNIVNSHTFTIMSDKQKGLIEIVQTLLPNAPHHSCQIANQIENRNNPFLNCESNRIVNRNDSV